MAPVDHPPASSDTSRRPGVPTPPATRRQDLVETVHGTEVADPYRWLEEDGTETAAWVTDQNRHTRAVLDAIPARAALRDRVLPLLQADTANAPQVAGTSLFTLDRGGDLDQAVLRVRSALEAGEPPRVVVDPVALTGDPTAAVDWYQASPDGTLVAYGLSTGGDEQSTLHVVEVADGVHLADTISDTRAASIAWLPDGSGFGYARYPDPAGAPESERGYGRHVRWHTLGNDPALDPLVFEHPDDPTAWPDVSISVDGQWLLVHVAIGWSRTDVHLIDRSTGDRTVVIEGVDAVSGFEVVAGRLIGHTTLDAPRGRLVAAPIESPTPAHWTTVVPEGAGVIEGFVATGARSLLIASTERAVAVLTRRDIDLEAPGRAEPIALPGPGALTGLTASHERDEAFVGFASFTRPSQVFRSNPDGMQPWTPASTAIRPGDYTVEHATYPSTDGTEVGMFLVRGSDTTPSVDTPVVLTGYGGFGVTMGPAYSPAIVAVCDRGGMYAIAGIRGGSEEGEAWHRAGMRQHKQQVFDDFCAAADWLVESGLTSRARLAIRGGSNGGLLVGAALTQRPDLCAAVHCAVPLLDMARFDRFLIARLWIPEYGDPDVAEEFAWLLAYSPYHRVRDGTCYPAVLLTTGEEDSRVHPAHARKMAARLQAATACGAERPVLLQVEARAGHGQGKPVSKQADELADVLAFLDRQLAP